MIAFLVPTDEAHDPGDGSARTAELRGFLAARLPEHMVPAVFVLLETLPLTPNGKIDRVALSRMALPAPERVADERGAQRTVPSGRVEQLLAKIWGDVLGRAEISVDENFFAAGGDSILAIQVVNRVRRAGLKISVQQIFQYPTVAGLATVAEGGEEAISELGTLVGELPLTPIQRWFFEHVQVDLHHYNQALLFALPRPLAPALLAAALRSLVLHHDALRLRFTSDADTGWRQTYAGAEAAGLAPTHVDLAALTTVDLGAAVTAGARQAQTSLDLGEGPLVRCMGWDLGAERGGRLLIVAHHLVVDGVSWRVLLEDLGRAVEQLGRGAAVDLGPKTTSLRQWAEGLAKHVAAGVPERELGYWTAKERAEVSPLPIDMPGAKNLQADVRTLTATLDAELTRELVQDVPAVYNTQVSDALLAALALSLRGFCRQTRFLVDLEGHGREDLVAGADLSRTVGWFTALYPVLLDLSQVPEAAPGEALKAVKELLRAVPGRGVGYGLLRYGGEQAGESARRLRALPQAEVLFNYLGNLDPGGGGEGRPEGAALVLRPAPESVEPSISPRARRTHLIEVDGSIAGGRLSSTWSYSARLHRRETVQALADGFLAALAELIAHCRSPQAGGFTPSDFPLLGFDQEDIEDAFAEAEFEG